MALGRLPQDYAGLQNAIRFGFKVVAGAPARLAPDQDEPRAGILVTSCLYVAAKAWAIVATGTWYLLAFGLYGAGELVGVYAPNYILSASRPSRMRRNMALVTLMMAPVAPAASLFGAISDRVGRALRPGGRVPDELRRLRRRHDASGSSSPSCSSPPGPRRLANKRASLNWTSNDDLTVKATGLVYRNPRPHLRAIHAWHPSLVLSRRRGAGRLVRPRPGGREPRLPDLPRPLRGRRPDLGPPAACSTSRPPGARPTRSAWAGRRTGRSSASAAGTTATTRRKGWSTGATSAMSRWT